MKILYFNELLKATLYSPEEDPNYEVAGLKSPVLKKRWQSTSYAGHIEIDDMPSTINCMYIGWTNAISGVIQVSYSPSGSFAYNRTFSDHEAGPIDYRYQVGNLNLGLYAEPQFYYFKDILGFTETGIRRITLNLQSAVTEKVFLGGLAFGTQITLKDPTGAWSNTFDDNSMVSETLDGQSSQSYLRPLKQYSFEFAGLTYLEKEEMLRNYLNIGKGALVWADFFERNRDYCKPGYFKITGFSVDKKGRNFNVKMSFKEAR